MKNSSDTIGNRARDLPAYSAVLMLPSIVRLDFQTPYEVNAARREPKEVTESVGRRTDKFTVRYTGNRRNDFDCALLHCVRLDCLGIRLT